MKLEYTLLDAIIFPRNNFFAKYIKFEEPECFAKISEAWGIWGISLQGKQGKE